MDEMEVKEAGLLGFLLDGGLIEGGNGAQVWCHRWVE